MFFDQQIVRVRAGTRTDRAGNTVPDWSEGAVSRITLDTVSVQPRASNEPRATGDSRETDSRALVVTSWHVQTPPGTNPDITATDRIEWDGLVLEVLGEVARWTDPLDGTPHHAEWDMTRATG